MKRQKGSKGFTLVEVIVVLVILAILAAILIPTYTGYIKKTEKTKCAVQRGDLEKKFIAMYNYDPKIRSCTTTADVTKITGTDVADYMLKNGYYEGETKCPVYDQNYEFKLVPSGAGYRGEFTCECVGDEFSKFVAAVKKAAEELKKNWADTELIEKVYNSYGSLPKVSAAELTSAEFDSGATMYWRPYQLGNGNIIYFANSIPYDESKHGRWKASIVKVDGAIYSIKDKGGADIAGAKDYKNKYINDFVNNYLIKNGFEKK